MKHTLLTFVISATVISAGAICTSGNCPKTKRQQATQTQTQKEAALLARPEIYSKNVIDLARNPVAGSKITIGGVAFALVKAFPALTSEAAESIKRTLGNGYSVHTTFPYNNIYAQLLVLAGPSGKHYNVYVGV